MIVPLLGNELATAIENKNSAWEAYITSIVKMHDEFPNEVLLLPCLLDASATDKTKLGELLGKSQFIGIEPKNPEFSMPSWTRCRDTAQAITQFIAPDEMDKLNIFISHTKKSTAAEGENVDLLIDLVRNVIQETRLQEFFDAHDLQPGTDWADELKKRASDSALLAIRTDLYPSREWCQREMLLAKEHGMPIVTLDAIGQGEERGSFLMDHIPRIPARMSNGSWSREDVYRGLNILVDQCMKRALWLHQEELSKENDAIKVDWWSPSAPEPITLIKWIDSAKTADKLPSKGSPLCILHPDPPLGPEEKIVMLNLIRLAGISEELDIMTPRQLASRGG